MFNKKFLNICLLLLSLPSPGAWIEIRKDDLQHLRNGQSLPSPGAWIEMLQNKNEEPETSRSLHRERGLKFFMVKKYENSCRVAPFTGSVD